jgi:hypothetical protein
MAAIGGNADDHGAAKASAGLIATAQRLEAGTAHFGGALGGAALGFALCSHCGRFAAACSTPNRRPLRRKML